MALVSDHFYAIGYIAMLCVLFQDGCEVFLQYFWVDKYATHPGTLITLNSCLMACVGFVSMINMVYSLCRLNYREIRDIDEHRFVEIMSSIASIIFSLVFRI